MLDREACIAANLIAGIGFVKYTALSRAFGSPAGIPHRTLNEYLAVPGIGQALAEKLFSFDFEGETAREMELADRAGVRIITLFDENYPAVLRNLYDPPLCLYVRGRLPAFPDNAAAIVGSRRMTSYGERMTRIIAEGAVSAGFVIVSGLAFGVDTAAHLAAVENRGITAAVLGGGLMHLHPRENTELARRIVETGGALVSEFPMDMPVSRTTFPRRNRIVAGLCAATIVTEAGADSGSLITARLALEAGRDVYAVPGRADTPCSKGCHQLIREGAGLIEDFGDVMAGLNSGLLPIFRSNSGQKECRSGDAGGFPADLSPEAQRVWGMLEHEKPLDTLLAESGYDSGTLLAILMRLEMKLLVEHGADQIYRRM